MAELSEVRELLRELSLLELDGEVEVVETTVRFANYTLTALDAVDPDLVAPSTLTDMKNTIAAIDQRLEKLRSSGHPQTTTSARTQLLSQHLGELIVLARQLPTETSVDPIAAIGAGLRADAVSHIDAIKTQASAALAELASERTQEFSDIEKRQGEARSEIEHSQTELEDKLGSLRSEAVRMRSELATLKQTSADEASAAVTDAESQFAAARVKFDDELRTVEEQRVAIETLAGELAGHAAAYDYSARAKHEEDRAERWAVTAIALLGLTIVLGVLQLFGGAPDLAGALARLALAAVVLGAGGLCLRISAEHRRAQRRYRGIGLQLATLPAYLASLDPTDSVAVRTKLVETYFTGHTDGVGAEASAAQETTLNLIGKALDIAAGD